MYLISLYFDEKTNRMIQRYIDNVAMHTGNTFMTDHNVPPHMTICAIEAKSIEELVPAFESLNGRIKGGDIQFVSTGQLLPYVFYITPVLNDHLQDMSKTIYDAFAGIPQTSISRFYKPSSWLPHVTVAKTLSKEQMQEAFKIMQNEFTPFDSHIVRLGLSRVNPHIDVSSINL